MWAVFHAARLTFLALMMLGGVAFVSGDARADACPTDLDQFHELHQLHEKLERELKHRLPVQQALLSDGMEKLSLLFGYGPAATEGDPEQQVFSYFFLRDEEERQARESLQVIVELAEKNDEMKGFLAASRQLQLLVPFRNLWRSRVRTVEKLSCLPPVVFEKVLGLRIHGLIIKRVDEGFDRKLLPQDFTSTVGDVVRHEFAVWPDTILKGDYALERVPHSQQIDAALLGGRPLAFEVKIAAPAVFFGRGNCSFAGAIRKWIGVGCVRGQIAVKRILNHRLELVPSHEAAQFEF